MSTTPIARRLAFALAATVTCVFVPLGSAGFTLDWDTVGWPGGSGTLTNTFLDVDGSGYDVEVTFLDPDGVLVQTSPDTSPASPTTGQHLNPPTNTGDNLFVRADGNGGGVGVTVRFDFTHATYTNVVDLVVNLFDVDTADLPDTQWIDDLVITGFAVGGGSVFPTSVTSPTGNESWTWNGATGALVGDTSQGNQGNTDDDGTAIVTFSTPITGFQFVYLNGYNPGGNQWIAVSDVTFIPEPGTIWLLALGLAGLALRHRRASADPSARTGRLELASARTARPSSASTGAFPAGFRDFEVSGSACSVSVGCTGRSR